MPRILIVGGGYAGFYTAWKLEKWLQKDEAEIVVVDPLPYLTYQPFLPEVVGGSVEARHAVVLQRKHLKRSRVITAKVTAIDHAAKTAQITPEVGEPWTISYDQILRANLKVMDTTAVSLCRDNNMPMMVFSMREQGNITRVVAGEPLGTLVTP